MSNRGGIDNQELNIIFYYEAKQHSTNIIFDKSTYTEDLFRNIHNRAL